MLMTHAMISDWQYASTADIADTTAVEVAAAPGSARRHRVVGVDIHNSDIAVGTVVNVRSGTTVLWSGFVSPYVAAAPGASHIGASFLLPLKGGVNEAINVICVTTSAQVRVSLQGFVERAGALA